MKAIPDVLVIEDSRSDIGLLKYALDEIGDVNATFVPDGNSALLKLADQTYAPTLVILDLNLPELDGHGVLESIAKHSRSRDLKVVIFTSSEWELDMEKAFRRGADAYIIKPTTLEDYVTALRTLVRDFLP